MVHVKPLLVGAIGMFTSNVVDYATNNVDETASIITQLIILVATLLKIFYPKKQ